MTCTTNGCKVVLLAGQVVPEKDCLGWPVGQENLASLYPEGEEIMKIVNFSDARNSLKSVIDQVVEDADVAVISRRDAPDAVVMSFDHYNSLMETVYLLSTPANAAHLAASIGQLRSGRASRRQLIDVEADQIGEKHEELGILR